MRLAMSICTIIAFALACQDKQSTQEDVAPEQNPTTELSNTTTDRGARTILCFGNSLTAGYGLDEDDAWPMLLQQRIDSLELVYEVVNAGLSGETSKGGLGRIDWVLNQSVDIFILELGANDMLRGLDVDETRKNLDSIIQIVKTANPEVTLITAGMLAPPNMGQQYESKFNAIFPELAKKHDGYNIPFFLQDVAMIDSLNIPDGKHPNEAGQKIVLENVWRVLKDLL